MKNDPYKKAGVDIKAGNDLVYKIKKDVALIVKETKFYKKNHSILFQVNEDKYLFDLPLLIKESLKLQPRKYLFIQKNGEPYDKPNTFNRWANRKLKSLFGKKNISLSTLRHIYITRRDLKLEEKSGLERSKVANVMGHSVGTQQNYLWHTYVKEKNKKE